VSTSTLGKTRISIKLHNWTDHHDHDQALEGENCVM